MQLKVTKVPVGEPELLEIKCHRIGDEVQEIISFIKSRQGVLNGKKDGNEIEKPAEHRFTEKDGVTEKRMMSQIGG